MQLWLSTVFVLILQASGTIHHRYRRHFRRHHLDRVSVVNATPPTAAHQNVSKVVANQTYPKEKRNSSTLGHVRVNGPLPVQFSSLFAQAVSQAEGVPAKSLRVVGSKRDPTQEGNVFILDVEAQGDVLSAVERDVADPASHLAQGPLRQFLVSLDDEPTDAQGAPNVASQGSPSLAPSSVDYDTEMPFGQLEPFGREDTAQELTEEAIKESDEMVDQLERAEVAEEKRAVFRALTRLRGEAISSFDGIARAQTGNIDGYSKLNKWRRTHPLSYLASEEADVSKWAFPESVDF